MSKLTYEKRDRIAYVTINRPEARNAIDPDVHRLMVEAWADFRDDDSVDVAILTGAGEAFCAGADLKTYIPPIIGDASPSRIREIVELGLNGFTRGMHRIAKPIIGAINGWALAGGLETALACDIRVASERAMFGSFEARRGFHHGDGGIVRLVNTCGVGVAMQMLLTAEPIDAQRALACNMVTKVVPHERLMEEAELTASHILRNSQSAVRSAKQTILDVIGQPLDFQLRTEAWNAYTCADPEETRSSLGALLRQVGRGTRGRPRDRAVKKALVTGAAGGIGAAIAARLRADGLDVATLDRAPGCDHTLDLAVDPLPELEDIDVCVSNAAILDTIAPAHAMTAEQWSGDIDVNLTGAFRVIQACLAGMRSRGWGGIVAISSGAARAAPRAGARIPLPRRG